MVRRDSGGRSLSEFVSSQTNWATSAPNFDDSEVEPDWESALEIGG